MVTLSLSLLFAWLAGTPAALFVRPPRPAITPPPRLLNIVRQKLRRGTPREYESLEASIVKGYERAHAQVFWIGLQSKSDATDVLYLNLADSREQWDQMAARYQEVVAAHPELPRLQSRLAALGAGAPTSTLTTRRDEIGYSRTDVDLLTMRALRLVVFHVKAGREGAFVRAARTAEGRMMPWSVYESNEDSTFFLVAPMRSVSEARKTPAIPLRLQQLKRVCSRTETGVYLVRPTMSHPPKN